MHNFKKLLATFLALIMTVGLLACGKEDTTPPPTDGQVITETPAEAIGTVTLVGAERVILHYDTQGNVITITDKDGVVCYSHLLDTPCAEAASQIMKEAERTGAAPFLLIKQNAGSLEPSEDFLSGITAAVKEVAGGLPIIVSSVEDQTDMGYFSAETATAVLAAYLGDPADTAYEVISGPTDGYYELTATGSIAFATYTVGALYGSVEQMLEPTDDTVVEEDLYLDLYTDGSEFPESQG